MYGLQKRVANRYNGKPGMKKDYRVFTAFLSVAFLFFAPLVLNIPVPYLMPAMLRRMKAPLEAIITRYTRAPCHTASRKKGGVTY